jgi:hypothetical protein
MIKIAILLCVLFLGLTQAVRYCCTGSYDSNYPFDTPNVVEKRCLDNANAKCISNTTGSLTTLDCANDATISTGDCDDDYCNCPAGFNRGYDPQYGEMKKIMFPVMGVIFGLLWVLLALFGNRIAHDIVLLVVGIIDAIFGVFLIFLPITTFLGLFYIAIGALTIAIARHYWGGHRGIDFYLVLVTIIFLLTGGLTFVAFDWGIGGNYFNRIPGYHGFVCDRDMNIYSPNRISTRCGNYAYFVAFCVYLLFLIQPIAIIFAAFKRVDHHKDTTVVVNEKHKK